MQVRVMEPRPSSNTEEVCLSIVTDGASEEINIYLKYLKILISYKEHPGWQPSSPGPCHRLDA